MLLLLWGLNHHCLFDIIFYIRTIITKAKVPMKGIQFKCKDECKTLFCLANDWVKGRYRYSLELSDTETPKDTILVVGVNPGGKTDPEEQSFGRTVRYVCDLTIGKGKPYDSALFVNLTPEIEKDPSRLKDIDSTHLLKENIKNIENIKSLIQERRGRIHNVLFCYGNSYKYNKESFSKVIKAIEEALPPTECEYWCLGISKKGYPIHPLARMKDKRLTKYKRHHALTVDNQ